jgi:hypothetical protein
VIGHGHAGRRPESFSAKISGSKRDLRNQKGQSEHQRNDGRVANIGT